MNGPTDLTVTGSLKSVDVAPNSECVVIASAAHVANYDRPIEHLAALRAWMAKVR